MWACILYFQMRSNESAGHKGHCNGTLVHGEFGENLAADLSRIGKMLGHVEFLTSTCGLRPLVKRMMQLAPRERQRPQGRSAFFIRSSCKMWAPICFKRLGPVSWDIKTSWHNRHVLSLEPWSLDSGSHTKQAADHMLPSESSHVMKSC